MCVLNYSVMSGGPPGCFVHGDSPAIILEQAAVPSSRGKYVSEGGKAYAEEERGREAGVGRATSIFWWS